ncbi:cupin domain-containing protein [Frankia canadensis]|nr:cupin domain-containing protein [Frankia canadensis]
MEGASQQQRSTNLKLSAGPVTRPDRMAFFDIAGSAETNVPSRFDDTPSGTYVQALVNPPGGEGLSLLGVRYAPNSEVARHKHDVPQIVLVLEGEIRQGRRVFGPGSGYYTPPNVPYKITVGPEGARLLEFRATPLTFQTLWLDGSEHDTTTRDGS